MKKIKLLVLPVVMMMTACGSTSGSYSDVELPSGGEEIKNDEQDTEKAEAYNLAVNTFTDGVLNTFSTMTSKTSLTFDVEANNIPVGKTDKLNFKVNGQVDLYIARADLTTADSYNAAKLDVKNLNLTVNGIPMGDKKANVSVTNLNLSAIYQVVTVDTEGKLGARLFVDLSDESVLRNATAVVNQLGLTPMLEASNLTVEMLYNQLLGANHKGYVDASLVKETLPIMPTDETEVDVEVSIDSLADLFAQLDTMLPMIREMLPAYFGEEAPVQFTLKGYKDENGEYNKFAAGYSGDVMALVSSFGQGQPVEDEEGTAVATATSSDLSETFTKLNAGFALVVSKLDGASQFSFEEATVKVDAGLVNGITLRASLNAKTVYGEAASFALLTADQLAEYNVDILAAVKAIVNPGEQQPELPDLGE